MRFHFALEGVLRLRRLLEEQARQQLDEAMSQLRALENSLAEAIEWSHKTATIHSFKMPLPAAEVQFIQSVLFQTQQAILDCQRRKQLAEEHVDRLRAAYLDARRERETVSILRENALRQFQVEQSRREQSEMDEIFLGKLIHTRLIQNRNAARLLPSIDDRNLT